MPEPCIFLSDRVAVLVLYHMESHMNRSNITNPSPSVSCHTLFSISSARQRIFRDSSTVSRVE